MFLVITSTSEQTVPISVSQLKSSSRLVCLTATFCLCFEGREMGADSTNSYRSHLWHKQRAQSTTASNIRITWDIMLLLSLTLKACLHFHSPSWSELWLVRPCLLPHLVILDIEETEWVQTEESKIGFILETVSVSITIQLQSGLLSDRNIWSITTSRFWTF